MLKTRAGCTTSVLVAVLAAVFAFSAIDAGYAAERKSIRWATSTPGSYGYKVAAQMVKELEDALGGEYTVTVNPYPSPTVCMKAMMNGEAEISYTADVGMTQFVNNEGAFKGFVPTKPKIVHTWYAYPMESFMAVIASKGGQYKSLRDFSGKPVFFTPAGFMNWLLLADGELHDLVARQHELADQVHELVEQADVDAHGAVRYRCLGLALALQRF